MTNASFGRQIFRHEMIHISMIRRNIPPPITTGPQPVMTSMSFSI